MFSYFKGRQSTAEAPVVLCGACCNKCVLLVWFDVLILNTSFWMDMASEQPSALQLSWPALGTCRLNSQIKSIVHLPQNTSHFLCNFLPCHHLQKPPKRLLYFCSLFFFFFNTKDMFYLTKDLSCLGGVLI